MEKKELIAKIADRYRLDHGQVEMIINQTIAELASPGLLSSPGEEVGFINDNNCKNNCKQPLADIAQEI